MVNTRDRHNLIATRGAEASSPPCCTDTFHETRLRPGLRRSLPIALLWSVLASLPSHGEQAPLGRVGDATVIYTASDGLDGLKVIINDVHFRPLSGAGALGPGEEVDSSIALNVEPVIVDDVLRLAFSASHTKARGLDPGVVRGLGEWRRLDLSRYAAPYGQTWWPKTTYSVKGDFWFTAHWVIEESDGTRWQATDQRNRVGCSRQTRPLPIR